MRHVSCTLDLILFNYNTSIRCIQLFFVRRYRIIGIFKT